MTVLRLRRSKWQGPGGAFRSGTAGWMLATLGVVGFLGVGFLGSGGAGAATLAASQPLLTWSTVPAAVHPPALANASVAYDSDDGTVVLFGGAEAHGKLSDDTWVWNGASWTDYRGSRGSHRGGGTPVAQAPPARQMASMAFDPDLHQLILFGGTDGAGDFFGDTWAWNGVSWYQVPPGLASPTPRYGAAMAYDGSGNLVLFGGMGDASSGDAGSGATSAAAASSTSVPAPSTSSVISTTAATSAKPVALDDTWLWTASGWVESNATGPSARSGAVMASNPAKHDAVLYGGEATPAGSGPSRPLGDTWTWNGSAWKRASPHASPGPLEGATLTDDPMAGGLVLAGGLNADGAAGATWLWNGSNWARLSTSGAPSPRTGAAATYDTNTGQVVLFGGNGSAGLLDDTLTLSSGSSTSFPSTPASSSAGTTAPANGSGGSIRPGKTRSSPSVAGGGSRAHRTTPSAAGSHPTATAAVRRNELVTLAGSGFEPHTGIVITFHSSPQLVGYATADNFGYFRTSVPVPATAAAGVHHFDAAGKSSSGGTTNLVVAVRVVVPSDPPSPTAHQKLIMVAAALLIPLAAWLVMGGADWTRARARRRRNQENVAH